MTKQVPERMAVSSKSKTLSRRPQAIGTAVASVSFCLSFLGLFASGAGLVVLFLQWRQPGAALFANDGMRLVAIAFVAVFLISAALGVATLILTQKLDANYRAGQS
ncbi:MAG TPA: hypothetical protein VFB45_10450 [Pseudolabrys sp.]|nr:hypothetical protein [Pseudolabrys sp.]